LRQVGYYQQLLYLFVSFGNKLWRNYS